MKHRKKLGIEMGRVSAEEYKTLPESGIVVVLDNVRSAHNVGSVFRSADSFKADRILLCGICATPPSAEIHKSALGAEFSVDWEHYDNTMDAIEKLHAEDYEILCVEQAVDSIMLDRFTPAPGKRYALVFGNEVDGVAQDVIEASDGVIEIPQYGTKHSLNISVTAGIILWHFRPRQEASI
ncbi:MAG: TrmH family RNA methyltransferase [Candidatus Cryptobacteroides sp.]